MEPKRAHTPSGLVGAARRRVAGIEHLLGTIRNRTYDMHVDVAELRDQVRTLQKQVDTLTEALRVVAADDAHSRREVRRVRQTDAYELAFTDPDPLVSVVIPTWDGHELLRQRAIPSVLAQTHTNLELVIVGDEAPPEAEQAANSFGDPRIRYFNQPMRGPYPEDPDQRWCVAGTPPANAAMAQARGRWIAPMADDDAMRPDHLERLLAAARERRLELVYGRFAMHWPDGHTSELGSWPPQKAHITLQAALQHGELGFFELELADAVFEVPSDWAKIERMMRAGVRFGMIDDVVVDIFPSAYWNPRGTTVG